MSASANVLSSLDSTGPKTSVGKRVRERDGRETARPIKRILDSETRDVVGWLYEWNTGVLMPMWKAGEVLDVVYE